MGVALDLAHEAAEAGEVPVGALVLDGDGVVIGRGRNRREVDGNPLAHAEVMAMGEAAASRKGAVSRKGAECISEVSGSRESAERVSEDAVSWKSTGHMTEVGEVSAAHNGSGLSTGAKNAWNLADCTLVVTLEPCPMCAGAALQAHVGRIVFGAWDAKLGACGSVWDIPRDPHVGARPEVIGGVRESECAQLLTEFFSVKR